MAIMEKALIQIRREGVLVVELVYNAELRNTAVEQRKIEKEARLAIVYGATVRTVVCVG